MSYKGNYRFHIPDQIVTAGFFSSLIFLPILIAQAWWIRRRVLRLPSAVGTPHGTFSGAEPIIHVLGIGESTVAGVGVVDYSSALIGQASKTLNLALKRKVSWQALGKNGATVSSALKNLLPLIPNEKFNVVILAFGANDVLEFSSTRKWILDLTQMISEIRKRLGAVPIILAGVPPMGYFQGFPPLLRTVIGLRASILERKARHLANQLEGVVCCADAFKLNLEIYYATDRIHPSEIGYVLWGRELAKVMVSQLSLQGENSRA